ncbi:MAG TPA: aminotransferase class V-fold PLP-dependent enzyme [Solirubrobacteraceae bacterium]|nr:aminotransferase class V-fold PLP-dependent enzyme [Solirubrobacteraceae bacterium]
MDPANHGLPGAPLSTAEFRRLGHRVIDAIVDHWEGLEEARPITTGRADELRAKLAEPAPAGPTAPDAVIDQVLRDVLPFAQSGHHPRFFARIPGPSNPIGVLADALAIGHNAFVGSWTGGSGAATVELITLGWLAELFGLPADSDGAFVSGGSVANLTALAAARTAQLGGADDRAVVYLSDQTHAAVTRGLRVLGFADARVRVLETGPDLRLAADRLAAQVAADRTDGLRPFCVIATAGSTNTGVVDPLDELADLCGEAGMWLHADAAYGGPAVLSDAGRAALAGIHRVDSIAIDPHKWLFQPYEIGCVMVRQRGALGQTFALHPEYLADVAGADDEVNFFDRGIQLTRGFRALKLWMTIKVFGLDALRDAIDRTLALASYAEQELRRRPQWEIVTPASLAIVSFRRRWPSAAAEEENRRNEALVAAMTADGRAAISSTTLHGRVVLRLCTINPRTTREDIDTTIAALDELA